MVYAAILFAQRQPRGRHADVFKAQRELGGGQTTPQVQFMP